MLEDTGTALVITGATEVLMSTILVVDDDADTYLISDSWLQNFEGRVE
jgi:hypothetical protein